MYRLEDAAQPAFARHETFHPRYGWFRKAVVETAKRPDVFTREDATVELGVGKNMVRAIRFWGRAAKVLAESPNPERPRMPLYVPSNRGKALFDSDSGLDRYLELPGSLWLLHWWMLAPTCFLPVWWLAFNQFTPIEFTAEDLLNFTWDQIQRQPKWPLPVKGSVEKDVSCLLHTYAPSISGRFALDDLLDCPFRELGLIEPIWDDKRRFRFSLGSKPTLPHAIVVYACLDYLMGTDPNARTSTISHLTQSPGSPGRIFKLTEDALLQVLEEFTIAGGPVRMTSTAGAPQLLVEDSLEATSIDVLWGYYRKTGVEAPRPERLDDAAANVPPRLFDSETSSPILATEGR